MATKPLFAVAFFGGICFWITLSVIIEYAENKIREYIQYRRRRKAAAARVERRDAIIRAEKLAELNADYIGQPFTEADL